MSGIRPGPSGHHPGGPAQRPMPQVVDWERVDAGVKATSDMLREAEDAVVALRELEVKRASLYVQPRAELAAKYGVDGVA